MVNTARIAATTDTDERVERFSWTADQDFPEGVLAEVGMTDWPACSDSELVSCRVELF